MWPFYVPFCFHDCISFFLSCVPVLAFLWLEDPFFIYFCKWFVFLVNCLWVVQPLLMQLIMFYIFASFFYWQFSFTLTRCYCLYYVNEEMETNELQCCLERLKNRTFFFLQSPLFWLNKGNQFKQSFTSSVPKY